MKGKPVLQHAEAERDVDQALRHYLTEAGQEVALAFLDDLERVYRHIGLHAAAGSMRYAHAMRIDGLRCWPLSGFPYVVFYMDGPESVDVWRVLHGRRDIPASLQDAGT